MGLETLVAWISYAWSAPRPVSQPTEQSVRQRRNELASWKDPFYDRLEFVDELALELY